MAVSADKLSDADLDRLLASSGGIPAAPAPKTAPVDADKLSDADLDALLAKSAPAAPAISKGESFGRGALQGASLGFGDEASAAIDTVTSHIPGYRWLAQKMNAVGGSGAGLPVDDPSITYQERRDAYRAANEAAHAANPKTYLGGELAGGAATAVVPVAGAAKAATLGAKIATGAFEGAAIGGAAGLGNSNADLTKGEIGGAAKDTALGAAGGAVVGAAGSAVARGLEKLGTAAKNKLASKLLTYFGGDRENALATPTTVKKIRPAVEQLKQEVLTPEGMDIARTARANPEAALDMVEKHVSNITRDRKPLYNAVDEATGGFNLGDYTRYLQDQIKKRARVNTPQAKNEVAVLDEMIQDANETWGQQVSPMVPTLALRETVTGLQKTAGKTIGSIRESEQHQLMEWRADTALDFLNKHLDAAAKDYPELAPAVEKIREMNRRTAAWLAPTEALEDRIGKKATKALINNAAAAGGGATIGGIVGAEHGGVKGGLEGAAKGALAGLAAKHVIVPALNAVGRTGLRAGAAVGPAVSAASRTAALRALGRGGVRAAEGQSLGPALTSLAGVGDGE